MLISGAIVWYGFNQIGQKPQKKDKKKKKQNWFLNLNILFQINKKIKNIRLISVSFSLIHYINIEINYLFVCKNIIVFIKSF